MALSVKNMLGGGGKAEKEYKLNVETTYTGIISNSSVSRYPELFFKADNGYFVGFYQYMIYVFDANFTQVSSTQFAPWSGGNVYQDCEVKRISENRYFMAITHYYNSNYYTVFIVLKIKADGTVEFHYEIPTSTYRPYHIMQITDTRFYVFTYHSSGYAQMYTVDVGDGTSFSYVSKTMNGQSMSTIYTKELSNNIVLIYGSAGLCYFIKYDENDYVDMYHGWLHDSTQTSAFSDFDVFEYNGDIHVFGIASSGVAYPTYDVKYSLNGDTLSKEQTILAQSYSAQGDNIYFNDGLNNVVPHVFINTDDSEHIYAYGWISTQPSLTFTEADIKTVGSQAMILEMKVNSNGFFEIINSEYIPIVMLESYIKNKVYKYMDATYLTAYIAGSSTFSIDASTLPTYKIGENGRPISMFVPHNKVWGFSNGQVYPSNLFTYRMGNMIFMTTSHSGNYGRPYMCHVLMGNDKGVAIESVLEGVNSDKSLVYYALGNKSYLSTLENEFYIIERDNTREVYKVNVEIVEV